MRHHTDKIGLELFDFGKQFMLLKVFPRFAIFHDEAIRNEKVITKKDSQKRMSHVDPNTKRPESQIRKNCKDYILNLTKIAKLLHKLIVKISKSCLKRKMRFIYHGK